MQRLMQKNLMKITMAAGLGFASLGAYAQTGDSSQKPVNQKKSHEMTEDGSSMMGMMAMCRQMMGGDMKCPMHDSSVSIEVTETDDGAIVKWTADVPAAVERIQKMARHMEQMKVVHKN